MFAGIRWRLVAWSLLVSALILAALGGAIYLSVANSLMAEVDRGLAAQGDTTAPDPHELSEGRFRLDRAGYQGGLFALIVAANGRVLANPQQVDLEELHFALPSGGSPEFQTAALDDEPARLYLRPLTTGAGPVVLIIGQSLAPEQGALRRLLAILLVGGVAGLSLSFLGAWFLAGRALVPIAQAFRRQQEFVADASHELRTPLTILRSAADLLDRHRALPPADRELVEDIREELGRLERLAGDLLTLARSDLDQLDLAVGPVDLAALVAGVARRAGPLARERGVILVAPFGGDPLVVDGDPDRLQQVLLILVDNALKHTPRGGKVTLSTCQRSGEVSAEVRDTGAGIAPEQLGRVFDRFYRADRARGRGGAGLGLAIARSLVQAHGGRLTLTGAPGAGVTATIRLRRWAHAPVAGTRLGKLVAHVTRTAHPDSS
jgi:signal transduction histidine kinase